MPENPIRNRQLLAFAVSWIAYASTYLLRKPLGVVSMQWRKNGWGAVHAIFLGLNNQRQKAPALTSLSISICKLHSAAQMHIQYYESQQGIYSKEAGQIFNSTNCMCRAFLGNILKVGEAPDWKACRMRGGSLLHPNFLRGCICVAKQ